MRANFQKNYRTRYMILAAVCLGMALYFAYDGFIGYPASLKVAEAYEGLQAQELPSREFEQKWQELTTTNGWSSDIPAKSAEQIEGDIVGQYIFGLLAFAAGIPALVLLLKSRGAWVERTADGLETSWGQQMKYADVVQLDKKRWARKGIAKATYEEAGVSKVFVFDDFKYDREPIGSMLRDLEAVLKPEQIVGGPPEAAEDEPAEKDATADPTDNPESA